MATFKLYSDIVDEEEKIFLRDYWGIESYCYKDIDKFLAAIPEDDDVIDLRIHCRGGSCIEGWAMYDALRQSGKTIYTTVEGECSSMASVILLAAPLERRTAYKNAHFCIHNPAVTWLDADIPSRITADAIGGIREQLGIQEKMLRDEEEKVMQLYMSRTKAGRKELQDIMKQDKLIDAKKAIELGFISKTLAPNTALRINNQSINQMTKPQNTVAVRKSLLDRLLAKCGYTKMEDMEARDQIVTDKDNREFRVEREEGDPQVGDTAYPDGVYTLDDGTQVTIENSVIAFIGTPEPSAGEPVDNGDAEDIVHADVETASTPADEAEDNPDTNREECNADIPATELTATPTQADEATDDRVYELETKVSEQEVQIAGLEKANGELEEAKAALEERNSELQQQVEAKKDAVILTDEQKAILEAVNNAGGKQWLDGVTSMRSTFHANNRRFVDHTDKAAVPENETITQKHIREQKERYAASRK